MNIHFIDYFVGLFVGQATKQSDPASLLFYVIVFHSTMFLKFHIFRLIIKNIKFLLKLKLFYKYIRIYFKVCVKILVRFG